MAKLKHVKPYGKKKCKCGQTFRTWAGLTIHKLTCSKA